MRTSRSPTTVMTANGEVQTREEATEALPSERVHLQAYSAKGRGHEISLVPSKTLDTYLSPSEFVNTVSRRLGVDVMDSGRPCCYCGQHLDAQESHCLSCMAGRDATTQHNAVRDVYFDICERAGLRPISEAPNILPGSRPSSAQWSRAIRTEPICLDIAVINASEAPNFLLGSRPSSAQWSQSDSHGANLSGHSGHQC